jgi:hypothetical protein
MTSFRVSPQQLYENITFLIDECLAYFQAFSLFSDSLINSKKSNTLHINGTTKSFMKFIYGTFSKTCSKIGGLTYNLFMFGSEEH